MNDLQPINFPGLAPRRPLVIAGPCSAAQGNVTFGTSPVHSYVSRGEIRYGPLRAMTFHGSSRSSNAEPNA